MKLNTINDTKGHDAGDQYIKTAAAIISEQFKHSPVYRIGGDEFVIISPGMTVEAFEKIQKLIKDDCQLWTEKNESKFRLSISMGYVKFPSDKVGYQITPLLSEADANLYIEKRNKKLAT